ncbi:PAS domain-containing protein [Marinobacter sp.]|uniref:PAS domain-containing protein n=1 Tax=Marinobacter sp. TaxID=50741 RepID=UPI0035C679AC
MACEYLGLETGIVSKITGQAYTVHWQFTLGGGDAVNGSTFPLDQTYCSLLLRSREALATDHMGQSEYGDHVAYRRFGLECYLAAPFWVDGELFGTVNFSSRQPRSRPFTETEKMFVTLLARWVADTVYQQKHTETLNKLVTQIPGMLYQYRLWPDGRSAFPYTSPGIQDIYGITAEQAAVDAAPVFDRIHPDDLAGVAASIEQFARTLQHWQHAYRIRWQGGWHWVEAWPGPRCSPTAAFSGTVISPMSMSATRSMKSRTSSFPPSVMNSACPLHPSQDPFN